MALASAWPYVIGTFFNYYISSA